MFVVYGILFCLVISVNTEITVFRLPENPHLNRHCERAKRAWQSPYYGERTKFTQQQ